MTEFKKASAEVAEIVAAVQALEAALDDPASSAPELSCTYEALSQRTEALQSRMQGFSKRLTETDPITGELRYGERMRTQVQSLQNQYDALQLKLPQIHSRMEQLLALHAGETAKAQELQAQQSREAAAAANALQLEQAQRKAASDLAEQRAREAAERESARVATEASAARESRTAAEAARTAQAQEEREARERFAASLTSSGNTLL
jgi:chromosome segregation ATPase